ncbi:2-succinyl-5-enolpyruvyl-6-hydroxy-3-cyclohexene-1-carboxylic-acid synthase [Loigolactobacillus backii]|uniref:2-succinyl-5-enolpyruvyl-6-hydroxy-3-cyclohexene-1-carboxylate synthase n=1 Tax=Loigolactobacillus backii TaxID=375175 RepID=A0A192H2D3_9LACO|nr:2-succinyl-5-enolpyruvyl-6-hydroxy-3-cyclohexene-1-carboxylic-acid synthase [Loigolactobacillus backii]ANK62101.1 hypothetical protein AYR53_04550 [Loigolactobacillus backii]MDA5386708.1 2-succinyl-5-enolpyruvyl-6-hydroxy-3-cyclohexene-1-carboxylic-acid synthase [Loigolactobacillus backii]MDA5389233.1 2-succinyl-5-enolpyruvyl-6-hydroxy-3-cyclohexene-1-carboxylic-acid synthase [Loigolactobacillus backii]
MANEILTTYVTKLLQALVSQGVTAAVIAPGSRSTPVALLLAKWAPKWQLKLYVDVDERSAGFFALGIAKSSHKPVLLVCTSGTAAANFYPAVCEANLAAVPLIVLTTDRPPELTNVGAPQALDQDHFYGQQVRDFVQLPLPTAQEDALRYLTFVAQRAVLTAMQAPAGPVQLNLPLRKPLLPDMMPENLNAIPVLQPKESQRTLAPAALVTLKQKWAQQRGLILAGPMENTDARQALVDFAASVHWPILADPLSGLRGFETEATIVESYDLLLKAQPKLATSLQPDLILRCGGTFVAASLADWLKQVTVPIYYLDETQRLADYTKTATVQLAVTPRPFFEQLTGHVIAGPKSFATAWQGVNQQIKRILQATWRRKQDQLDEPQVAALLATALPATAQLFSSNSMPIRDLDSFYWPTKASGQLYCNRGANGIDGVTSTALGVASQTAMPHYLLTGDLAFFHDMNGLMLTRRYPLQLTVIVINNNGGGIFSFLPQANAADYFETLFGTPQDLELEQVAKLYHGAYQLVTQAEQLTTLLQRPQVGLQIIEVRTEREANVAQHQALVGLAKGALAEMGGKQ